MTSEYDLIIVGAGPGGSNAARAALRRGLSVAQVDKRPFPRVKPCAGGLTMKSCRALQLELDGNVRSTAVAFEFNVWTDHTNRFSHSGPIVKMVVRPEFDNALVEQNTSYDRFAFFPDEGVRSVTYSGGRFDVETSRRRFTGRQLIGADGAYSLVNKTFGISKPKAFAVALEVNLEHTRAPRGERLVPGFDFGAVPRGYGWVFPKHDHSSVGLYSLARGLPQLRARLLDYIAARGFETSGDPLASFEAFQIPVGGYKLTVPDAPVYIVGDAGGFADALTGEGIYHALESGRLAGDTAADVLEGRASHRRYYRKLWRTVLPDTMLTYHLAQPFYRHPATAIRLLRSPLLWRPFVQGYAEGATFTGSLAKGGYYLTRSLFNGGVALETTRARART